MWIAVNSFGKASLFKDKPVRFGIVKRIVSGDFWKSPGEHREIEIPVPIYSDRPTILPEKLTGSTDMTIDGPSLDISEFTRWVVPGDIETNPYADPDLGYEITESMMKKLILRDMTWFDEPVQLM